MSSILNALKKLEHEESRTGGKVAWPERIDSRRTIRRWEIHSGRFTVTLWAMLAVVILIAAGWGLNYWLGDPGDAERPPIAATARIADSLPAPAPPVAPPAFGTAPPAAARQPAASQVPVHRAASTVPAPPKAAPPVRTGTEVESVPVSPKPKSKSPELLTEGFQLQAISWSERTEDRIAVINGNIVREGAVLDGYRIARIQPEEVIVSKADRRWRLVFLAR